MFETPIFRRFKSKQHRFERLRLSQPQARLTSRLSLLIAVKRLLVLTLLITLLLVMVRPANAALEKDKLAAVLTIINMYLLDEPSSFELELNEIETDTITINNSFTASFAQQGQDIELCFVVSGAQDLPAGSLSFSINGVALTGSAQTTLGENCYIIPAGLQQAENIITFSVPDGVVVRLSNTGIEPATQSRLGLASLTRSGWSERAVRKVLKIFAFGGHATDQQISAWSNTSPKIAIPEMLNFSEHNLKLSPLAPGERYREAANQYGKLKDFANFLSSENSNLPIPASITNNNGDVYYPREQYGLDAYNFDDGYGRMITTRGLNPFRQKIGFWETNYHLAVNLDASVSRPQLAQYYDEIMEAHESGVPYHEVMGVAAKSAAAAMQYGHRRNRCYPTSSFPFFNCDVNEDFAREIHQLYYGIFGDDDPNHESGTIKETAKMLTDMRLQYNDETGFPLTVTFETEYHHTADLTILGQTISGANASQKIDNLMPISILTRESLEKLPIMIISVLADDNLSEVSKEQLRAAWAALGPNKSFLEFIHAYATSQMFHGPEQIKYLTSHERALYMANKHNLDNFEAYMGGAYYFGGRGGRSVGGVISDDDAGEFFRPLHNVFGAQTSLEASDSALAFEKNYNRLTDDEYLLRDAVRCDECDNGAAWEKRWPEVLPRRSDGQYYVADVAAWLWNHAVGNMDNYTELERAHLYSLLGAARRSPGNRWDNDHVFDFNLLMCLVEDYQSVPGNNDISIANLMSDRIWDDYCRAGTDGDGNLTGTQKTALLASVYTGQSIGADPKIQGLLAQLGEVTLPFNTTSGTDGGADLREHARERVSNALGFIFTTPFVFAEGQ